jgi:hypothetical protein
MRVARMPDLRIMWSSDCPPNSDLADRWGHCTLKTKELLRFSDDTALVHLRLEFQAISSLLPNQALFFLPKDSVVKWFQRGLSLTGANLDCFRKPLLESLQSSDLSILQLMKHTNWPTLWCLDGLWPLARACLGPFSLNSLEIPWKDINFAEEEMSMDWKRLLNDLFREELYVRRQQIEISSGIQEQPLTLHDAAYHSLLNSFGSTDVIWPHEKDV